MTPVPHVHIAIAGTGFSGLGAAIRLKEEGETDFLIFEKADDLGGTWRDNAYPGCACDVPSHLYSFSYALNPDWTRLCSPQQEIQDYMRKVAEDRGIPPFIRYGHELLMAVWNDDDQRWEIETSGGRYTADIVISGMGALSEPSFPTIPGLDTFAGTAFHSAQWNHEHDLAGKRIAVIGTGASAVQFIPEIQPGAAQLDVYQRTAAWIVPRKNLHIPRQVRSLFRRVPLAMKAFRGVLYWGAEALVLGLAKQPRLMKGIEWVARRYLAATVKDPAKRKALTPSFRLGCKRILFTDRYLPALAQKNVDVITDGIVEVRPHSIVTADGTEREVDTIIYGTGFHVTDQPLIDRVRGRDGRLLSEHWDGALAAHNGTTIAGFPNLFTLLGPFTGLGHTSVVIMIEAQIEYIVKAVAEMRRRGAAAVDVRKEVQDAFVTEMNELAQGSVWLDGGCQSWYLDAHGNASTLWPDFTFRFRSRLSEFKTDEYVIDAPRPAREPAAA